MIGPLEKLNYLESKKTKCPFCESKNIHTVDKENNPKVIKMDRSELEMMCDDCKKHWIEVYPDFEIYETGED